MVRMGIHEISGSHSGVAEDTVLLLGCDAVSLIPDVSTKVIPSYSKVAQS